MIIISIVIFLLIVFVILSKKKKPRGKKINHSSLEKANRAWSVQRLHNEIWDSPLVIDKLKYESMVISAQGNVVFDGETLSSEEKKAHGIKSRRKIYKKEFEVFSEDGVRQNANAFFNSRFCCYMQQCQVRQSLEDWKKGTDKVELSLRLRNENCPMLSKIKEGIHPIDKVQIVPCEDCKESSYCTAMYTPKF